MTSISPLNKKVHRVSRQVTFSLKNYALEYAARVSNNSVVSQKITSNSKNYIYEKDFKKLPAYFPVFIHNHPSNSSFSSMDIKILINNQAKKLYIAKNQGLESLEVLKPEIIATNREKIIQEYDLEELHIMTEESLKKMAKDYKLIFAKLKWSDFK